MAWSDAGERLEALPTAGAGSDFAVSNRPAVSAPATAACRCRYQSLTAGSLIYDHVSINTIGKSHIRAGVGREDRTGRVCEKLGGRGRILGVRPVRITDVPERGKAVG